MLKHFGVARGEIPSKATQLRLNSQRQNFETISRGIPDFEEGDLSDAIYSEPSAAGFRASEYGASECSRTFTGFGGVWVADPKKLVLLLRGQVEFINSGTHGRSSVLRKVQTVGFLTAGICPVPSPPYIKLTSSMIHLSEPSTMLSCWQHIPPDTWTHL